MAGTVSDLLESRRIGRAQIVIALVIVIAMTVDGLDTQLLSVVAPVIISEWGIGQAQFGPALAAAVIGMAIGSGVGGRLGDRFGRKAMLAGSLLLFGVTTIGSTAATEPVALALLRFVSGLGFGAATPNALALSAEWLPRRASARMSAIYPVTVPLGGIVGSVLALHLLADAGWEGLFLICGGITIVLGVAIAWWVPESPSYLLLSGRRDKATRNIRRVLGTDSLSEAEAERIEAVTERSEAGRIFVRDYLRLNIGASLGYFSIAFVTFGLYSWTPVLLTTAGLSAADGIRGSLFINVAGLAGPFLAAWAIDRFGSKPTLLFTAFSTAAAIFLVMAIIASGEHLQSDAAKWVLLTAMGLCGTASGSLSGAIYSIASMGYPPSCRASGVGLVLMIGRIGGFITILTAGALLGFNSATPLPVFAVMAGAALVTACTALIIDRHIEGSRAIPVGPPAEDARAPEWRNIHPLHPGAPIGHGKTD
jgi:AAHS family 4-hydroxybenzoate transporter-like MFS transporter